MAHTGELRYAAPGQGTVLNVLGGDRVTLKAVAADTDGTFAVLETVTPAGCGPPPHVHHREDELFYVLDGTFEFHVGDQSIRATTGAFLIAPCDVPHHFKNLGSTDGKLLVIVRPAGFEKFLEELSQLGSDAPPDMSRLQALAERFGLEFL